MMLRRLLLLLLTVAVVCEGAGHTDMFNCRGKAGCAVEELTDANYAAKIASSPHFVMFYAPWCGHCKSLAPKLKKAAKELADFGVKVGAVDVEPNRNVQSQYPDIRGFPTLKFVKSAKSAEDYNGPREADAIVAFSKEQAAKAGSFVEPVAVKKFEELYSFFARAALDSKPALLLVGNQETAAPEWFSKLHADLKDDATGFEENAKSKLKEALTAAKDRSVKASIQNLLDDIDSKAKSSSKPLFTSAFTPDASHVFNASAIYAAFVDRKNLAHSKLCGFFDLPKNLKGSALLSLAASLRSASPESCDLLMPELPKPKSVLAAEERAARKKQAAIQVASITSKADLDSKCYKVTDRTCALILSAQASDDLATLAAKYARNNFAFSTIDAPDDLLAALAGDNKKPTEPTLVIVKGGRRPRAARATTIPAFDKLLDDVIGGSAEFNKFDGGLPAWPESEQDDEKNADYDL